MKFFGIDYGLRRIGLAVSDELGIIARGICTIDLKSEKNPVSKIHSIIEENMPDEIIIGYPYRQSGEKGSLTVHVDAFVKDLKKLIDIPIILVDESFSTEKAYESLKQRGYKQKKSKKHVDRIAACHILQSYMNGV